MRGVRPLMQEMVSRYDIIAAQTRADGRRLKFFGARRVCVVGNLKFDRDINAVLQERGKILRQRLRREAADKMIMLVAGTRAGEEEILTAAMDDDFMRRFFLSLLLRVIPRAAKKWRHYYAPVAGVLGGVAVVMNRPWHKMVMWRIRWAKWICFTLVATE